MFQGVCPHCGAVNQLYVEMEWYGPQLSCVTCGYDEYNPSGNVLIQLNKIDKAFKERMKGKKE